MRTCPVCQKNLDEIKLHSQVVDRCKVCNGIYFDQGELETILHIIGLFNQIELGEADIDTIPAAEKTRDLRCPADGQIMQKREVTGNIIDICPHCQGIWLDDREILALKLSERHIKDNLGLYFKLGH